MPISSLGFLPINASAPCIRRLRLFLRIAKLATRDELRNRLFDPARIEQAFVEILTENGNDHGDGCLSLSYLFK